MEKANKGTVLVNIKEEEKKMNKKDIVNKDVKDDTTKNNNNNEMNKEDVIKEDVKDDTTKNNNNNEMNKEDVIKEDVKKEVINKEKSEEVKNKNGNTKFNTKKKNKNDEKRLLNKLKAEIDENRKLFSAVSVYPEEKKEFIKKSRQITKIVLNKNAKLYNIVKNYDKEFYKNIKENSLSVYNYIYVNNSLLFDILKEMNIDIEKEDISYENCKKYFNLKNVVFVSKNKSEKQKINNDNNSQNSKNEDRNQESQKKNNIILDKVDPYEVNEIFVNFIEDKFSIKGDILNKFISRYEFMIPELQKNNLDIINNKNYLRYNVIEVVLTQYENTNMNAIIKYLDNNINNKEKDKFIMQFINNNRLSKILESYQKFIKLKDKLKTLGFYNDAFKPYGLNFIKLIDSISDINIEKCKKAIDDAKEVYKNKAA